MVPPRVDAGVTRHSLRPAACTRGKRSSHSGKFIFSVDALYNILKENPAVKKTRSPHNNSNELKPSTLVNAAKLADSSDMSPAIRKSARLLNKRAAELQLNPGVPQYWLRTRSRCRRPTLVSVKSLYPGSEQPKKEEEDEKLTSEDTPIPRRQSTRLFEKQAASLLICHRSTGPQRLVGVREKISKIRRKRKHICWLYEKSSWWVGSHTKAPSGIWSDQRKTPISSSGAPKTKDGGTVDSCSQCVLKDLSSRLALQRLTENGEEDLLHSIFEKLPPANLLQVARVCKSWARLCETIFKDECHRKGWSLPRIPRGVTPAYPWRSLYYRHACRACGKVGEFFVRKTLNGTFQFLLCDSCIRLPGVRVKLVQYSIDLYGVTGKLLVPNFNFPKSSAN